MMMQSIGLIRWDDVLNESVEPAAAAAAAARATAIADVWH